MDTLLDDKIVSERQRRAPELAKMIEQIRKIKEAVHEAKYLVEFDDKRIEERLSDLQERISRKHRIFEKGVITVSIAGLEKSGKTTMLKTLTGIGDLPTSNERCTSVTCEILYAHTDREEGIEIHYYTAEQLENIIKEQLGRIKKREGLWKQGKEPRIPEFTGLRDFAGFPQLQVDDLDPYLKESFKDTIKQLNAISSALKHNMDKVGQERPDKGELSDLLKLASHRTMDATQGGDDIQGLISKIVVYKNYENGKPTLRLCDTPGIDDPNPRALSRTLQTLRDETDILVVAHRPESKVDMPVSFTSFQESLRDVDKDSSIRNRSVFFLNCEEGNPEKEKVAKRCKQKLEEDGTFEEIYGPCNAMGKEALGEFIDHLNKKMENILPGQDAQLINKFKTELQGLKKDVEEVVLSTVRTQRPPLPKEAANKVKDDFGKWFARRNDPNQEQLGFIDKLTMGFKELQDMPAEIEESIRSVWAEVLKARDEGKERIQGWLQKKANENNIKTYDLAGESPTNALMKDLRVEMQDDVVEEITKKTNNLSVFIQEKVWEVIQNALGSDIAARLCDGSEPTPGGYIKTLAQKLKEGYVNESVQTLSEKLEEFANIPTQMNYITRYELRPALNVLDSLRWHDNRRARMVRSLSVDLLDRNTNSAEAKGASNWLKNVTRPSTDKDEKEHAKFLYNLCRTSFAIIDTVLVGNSGKFFALVEDFFANATQRLATQKYCENGWEFGLGNHKEVILPDLFADINSNNERMKDFEKLIELLENALR